MRRSVVAHVNRGETRRFVTEGEFVGYNLGEALNGGLEHCPQNIFQI